jgi:hypothetical protein
MTISISGGNYYSGYSGNYYIPYNSDSSTVQASVSGNNLSILGVKNGSVVVVICDLMKNCGSVSVSVGTTNNIYSGGYNNYSGHTFTLFLTIGSVGDEVVALQ